jgi:hypothetical protein
MLTSILQLTPSMSGWYYAATAMPHLPMRDIRPPESSWAGSLLPIAPSDPVCLGYGADGRPRLTSARSRLWLRA